LVSAQIHALTQSLKLESEIRDLRNAIAELPKKATNVVSAWEELVCQKTIAMHRHDEKHAECAQLLEILDEVIPEYEQERAELVNTIYNIMVIRNQESLEQALSESAQYDQTLTGREERIMSIGAKRVLTPNQN